MMVCRFIRNAIRSKSNVRCDSILWARYLPSWSTQLKGLIAVVSAVVLLVGMSATAAPAAQASDKKSVLTLLKKLPVESESRDGYDRDLFDHWVTTDGCTTREWVLIRQAISGTVDDCKAVNGEWFSYYDGATTDSSRSFDIDHMVPLAEAWDSGADDWSESRRERFANDLDYLPSLQAVSASSNRSKSDQDPSEWMPTSDNAGCRYLKEWVGTKYRWGLSVDPAEKAAIRSEVKEHCVSKKSRRMPVPKTAL